MKDSNVLILRLFLPLAVVVIMISGSDYTANANQLVWPREIDVPEGKIVVYQPQLETFKNDKMTARAAVSVTPKGNKEPIFGAVWLAGRVSTDRDSRIVTLLDIDVPNVKFPHADPEKEKKLSAILEREILKWNPTISLDRLLSMLDLIEKERAAAENLKTIPPTIIFKTHPAVLVTIDGDPILQKVSNSELMRVINTPFFIVFEPASKVYYLKGGKEWLIASEIKGLWQTAVIVPVMVKKAAQETNVKTSGSTTSTNADRMPQYIVATEPTELIVSEGEPKYSPISGNALLYMSNTENDVFMDIDLQRYFVLLSGRWYITDALEKETWIYVPSDKLLPAFTKIPPGSAKGHVLASVAGTVQSKEAILDTYIPQTATVNRSEAKIVVTYDGNPSFMKIEDSTIYYAINTPYAVLRIGKKYYCCHEAIWYEADKSLGPWTVCTAVPQEVYIIPPSCPVYHVKYVYVYDYTPTVVYVGYTPGYGGCYVYGGTVVYGTGYVYHGWHGRVYYTRPATWGVAVRYNPNTGNWGVRVGYRSPYGWGAGGFRYANVDIDINRNINVNRNIYSRPGNPANPRGPRDPRGIADPRGARDPRGIADPRGARDPRGAVTTPDRSNNVFADRNGNTYRKTDQGWQQRDRSGWSNSRASDRKQSNLNQQSQARNRGTRRTNSFDRSRSSQPSRSRGSRGGGRR